jgi:hypothetical protein
MHKSNAIHRNRWPGETKKQCCYTQTPTLVPIPRALLTLAVLNSETNPLLFRRRHMPVSDHVLWLMMVMRMVEVVMMMIVRRVPPICTFDVAERLVPGLSAHGIRDVVVPLDVNFLLPGDRPLSGLAPVAMFALLGLWGGRIDVDGDDARGIRSDRGWRWRRRRFADDERWRRRSRFPWGR